MLTKREASVLTTLYNYGLFYRLWGTYDVTWSGLWILLENGVAKRLKVPL